MVTRDELKVSHTVKGCINSHRKYRFRLCIKLEAEQLSSCARFVWVAEHFPVCAVQLIKCGAKDFIIVIDTISKSRGAAELNTPDRVCE